MNMTITTELSAKVILIAGAGRPIGHAIADCFGARGASLILPVFGDWAESNEEMKQQFDKSGYDFLALSCDLTSSEETKLLLEAVSEHFGRLDYLINNIDRGGMPIVHGSYDLEVNKDQWQLEFDTTLKAKWHLYQHSKNLLKKSEGGCVINISSIAAHVGRSGPASLLFNDGYSAANRGVTALTKQWAREMAPSVRVNELMIGLCAGRHGQETKGWALMNDKQQQELIEHTLLKRTGTPEEVAEFVYFLAVRAGYMTGNTVLFDGGYLIGGDKIGDMPPGILK